MSQDIKCDCGKLLAKQKDGEIYCFCKICKKEKPLKLEPEPKGEPKDDKD